MSTCEWCRERPATVRVELEHGHKVAAGWKAGLAIRVCAICQRTIQRSREATEREREAERKRRKAAREQVAS